MVEPVVVVSIPAKSCYPVTIESGTTSDLLCSSPSQATSTLNSCTYKLYRVFLQLPIPIALICSFDIVAPYTLRHSIPFPGPVVTMPRVVRSTRNNTKNKVDEKVKDEAITTTTNIEPSTTNSTRDPSIDSYKLHFELTDLKTTKSNTTPHTEDDTQSVVKQGQGGVVGQHSRQGSIEGKVESDLRVGEDRDGSGEPDHTSSNDIDQPRQTQIPPDRLVPRSLSPNHNDNNNNNNKYPIDPQLAYIPQYLHESESKSSTS